MSPAKPEVPGPDEKQVAELIDNVSPEGREEREAVGEDALNPVPCLTVLGHTAGGDQAAVRLGWRRGLITMSNSRLKFLREELEMKVVDNPDEYLF